MNRSIPLFALAVSCMAPIARATPPASQPASRTHIELQSNPFMDMHYYVRHLASVEADLPKLPGIDTALETVREIDKELGGPVAWGYVEGTIASCRSTREAANGISKLPPTFQTRDGRELNIRNIAQRLVRVYQPIEPGFLRDVWPRHQRDIEEARTRIEKELLPAQEACFINICRALHMNDPGIEIPVNLVARAPFPQGFTHRRAGGGAVCFVGIESLTGSTLSEVILHECIHALDISTEQSGSALQELRGVLLRYKVKYKTRAFHDAPHTLMFVQAAATVQAILDPSHKPYGQTSGYYAKVPKISEIVQKAWQEHLAGKLGREEAIMKIARDVSYLDEK